MRNRLADIVQIIALFAIESLTFLPQAKKIGFYLDDWATFCRLHFAEHNFFSVLQASLCDPRMITRPVQCFYYAITYMFFGDDPLGYHLLGCLIEFLGAVFLYLGLVRFFRNRLVACIASSLFVLYPSHDASHYWVGAGLGAGFGLTLYLLSFWFLAWGAKRSIYYFLSIFAFALCAYCYESYLPLLAFSFIAVFSVVRNNKTLLQSIVESLRVMLPFVLVGLSEPLYQRFIVPIFYKKVFLSPSCFDLNYFTSVFVQGLNVSLGPDFVVFVGKRIGDLFYADWSTTRFVFSILIVSIAALPIYLIHREKAIKNEEQNLVFLLIASLILILVSYLTFAVADGYTPILTTMINRVNTGASVGASILIAVCIVWLSTKLAAGKKGLLISLLISLPLLLLFVFADWGLSGHWIRSWQVQSRIRDLVAGHAQLIDRDEAVLLANCPRYVMWAPVFDGVWDFQEMTRMTLNRKNMSAGVVSERLELSPMDIKDRSAGFLCATYPYKQLTIFIPNGNEWLPVRSGADFITTVKAKGTGFDLPHSIFATWQKQLDNPQP
ncbi:MAG: hypothetical protein K2W82_07530 [Candidatus Obscuribacterales bacterium]|nr:hypothetical protein [Candidatus Obscuribacterales bacterium]